MTLELRCYAYRDDQTWEAICVDLDIATFSTSLEDVKASLAICIRMYLERVAKLPAEEQRRFLTRKSPWHLRARLAFVAWLSRFRGDGGRSRGYMFSRTCRCFTNGTTG